MPEPFLILGDSHVAAFLNGAREAGAGDLIDGGGWGGGRKYFDAFFEIEDGRIVPFRDRVYYDMWLKRTGRDLNECTGQLIVSMGLSATSLYNAKTWQTFGFGKTPLSDRLLNTILADMQVHVLAFYRAVIERNLIAAAYYPPAPQRRHPVFSRLKKEDVDDLVTRFQAPVLQLLESERVPVIRLPIADSEGYLLPEYAGRDPAHAGPQIGDLVAQALRELATTPEANGRIGNSKSAMVTPASAAGS